MSNSKTCFSSGGEREDIFLKFSPKYTAANGLASIAGIAALGCVASVDTSVLMDAMSDRDVWAFFGIIIACDIAGIVLGLLVAFSNRCCCKNDFEFGAILTSSPHTSYVIGPDGELVQAEGKTRETEEASNVGRRNWAESQP